MSQQSSNNTSNNNRNVSGSGQRRKNFRKPNRSSNPNSPAPSNNNRPHSHNKRRSSKPMTAGRLILKHDNLLEQYLLARKKYYELYARADRNQLNKLEFNYHNTLKQLREFEAGLQDWQKEVISKKIDGYAKDDLISTTYGEKPEVISFVGDFPDPHLLSTQITDFSQDKEESVGTQEDYNRYKESL